MIQNWLNNLVKKADIELYSNRAVITVIQKDGTPFAKEFVATKPFSSSRLLIADFEVARAFFKNAFQDIGLSSTFGGKTYITLTTKEKNEGGLCALEWRALLELMELSGAFSSEIDGIKQVNGVMS